MVRFRQEAATVVGYVMLAVFFGAGGTLAPASVGWGAALALLFVLFLIMTWLAFAVVRHAEGLATLLGEPYGTLILTLSVIGIEVALISSIMIAGPDKPALARDTMFSVLMIVLNGLVGISLLAGGLRHRTQGYNLTGANAYMAVLVPLAIFSLILPHFTTSAPGNQLSALQTGFLIALSVVLYGTFLAIQTVTLSDIFQYTPSDYGHGKSSANADGVGDDANGDDHGHGFVVRSVPYHAIGLVLAMIPIVLLSKSLAVYVDFGISTLGAPLAIGGFLIAALVLTPEALSAIQAARRNALQRAVNICLGSALATIGLTVPAVLIIGWMTGEAVELGLANAEIVMLSATLLVSLITFGSGRTNILLGVVHLALFFAYVMMIFDGAA